jgi:hypothetical protein
MVERYGQDWDFEPSRVIKRDNGPWVKFEHYKNIEDRMVENGLKIDKLESALAAANQRIAELEDQINNPKMTYCAFCGEKYDISDREKAIELITNHIYTCEKHPVFLYSKRIAELESESKVILLAISDAMERERVLRNKLEKLKSNKVLSDSLDEALKLIDKLYAEKLS